VDKRTHDLELNYQVNSAQALSKRKHRLVTFILDAHKDILQRIEQVIDYISVTIEALRVGRSAPRALKSFRRAIPTS
jgi:hypothetical protein